MGKEKVVEPVIKLELKASDVYQLLLCVNHRSTGVSQMFLNAINDEMLNGAKNLSAYLDNLALKLRSELEKVSEDANTTREKKN